MARHRALTTFHFLCIAPEPMTATMTGDDWLYEISSDDENDHRGGSDISDRELDHGTSPHSQLPPVPGALPFLDYHRWASDQSYDEQPPRWLLYTMQWKLTLNSRKAMEQTEQNLAIAPSDFWKEVLSFKVDGIVASKKKTYETSARSIRRQDHKAFSMATS